MLGGVPKALAIRMGWAGASYGTVQFLRLLNNVVLARLLAPQLFGLMLIVNSIRTGVELLSDVGITQNIVSNKRGGEPEFYNTAWTIQFIRGAILAAITIATAGLLANFFEAPELALMLPVMGIVMLFGGLQASSEAFSKSSSKFPGSRFSTSPLPQCRLSRT